MSQQAAYDQTQLTDIQSGETVVSSQLPMSNNLLGFGVTNVSPYTYTLNSADGVQQAIIPPWCYVTGTLNGTTSYLTLTNKTTVPAVAVAAMSAVSNWSVDWENSMQGQPAQIVPLPYANAANNQVSGTVELGAGTTVNITGPVTLASGTAVDVNTVGSIAETVTTSGSITNDIIPSNNIVDFGSYTVDVANLANGSTTGTNGILSPEQWGFFDGVIVLWSSANNYKYDGYSVYGWNAYGTNAPDVVTNSVAPINQQAVYFTTPEVFSRIGINLQNNTGATIASDTLTIKLLAIKATETVNNTSTNPVQQQMAQTFNGNSVAGFVNTDGSQGTNTGTPFSLIPTNSTNVTYFWLFYRNTGTSTQNILLSSAQSGGVNLFQDNIPAGGTLTIEWRMEGGGNLDAVWCTYSLASAGIINFMSNALEYPQNVTPTSVK